MLNLSMQFAGIGRYSEGTIIVFCAAAVIAAILVGMLIDSLSSRVSFGPYGNAIVLLASIIAGVALFARTIQPLNMMPAQSLTILIIGCAVTGFFVLASLKAVFLRAT